jgi:hypothetical protein
MDVTLSDVLEHRTILESSGFIPSITPTKKRFIDEPPSGVNWLGKEIALGVCELHRLGFAHGFVYFNLMCEIMWTITN